jgi:O-antigen/teichoic acid export membrane protein
MMNPPDETAGSEAEVSSEGSHGSDVFSLPRSEVRRRSLAGIFYLTASNVTNLLIGFFASLALARMLTPSDFGVVAIGSTAILIGGALADGGLGAGMIRRQEPPTHSELRTLNGIQLVMAVAVCLPAIAIALSFGRTGAVTAVMISSLPISMLQTPGRIVLNRNMRYDRQLAVDVGAQMTFQIFSVTAVALGAGVWGLATGSVVRAVVGTILTAAVSIGFAAPSLRGWRAFGGLIRFGLSFQANWLTWIAREQAINIVIGVVAGVASLGIWAFTNRLFQLPSLAFSSLYVVGFPAMSNLLARGEDPAPVLLRTVRRAAIAGAFIFPAFAAACPQLIPTLFGGQWSEAADILPFICLSTLILGSISVASTSYLNAAGRPGAVAWASVPLAVIWIVVTASLLPVIGVAAIGVGNLSGAVVEAFILDRVTWRMAGVAPYRPLLRPLVVAIVAGVAGWTLCTTGPSGLLIALAAAALAIVLTLVGLWLTCRADLLDMIRLVTGTVRSSVPRRHTASEVRNEDWRVFGVSASAEAEPGGDDVAALDDADLPLR